MPLLSLRQLEKSYGNVRALKALDLEVKPGQVLGLLGPNGAGKSTLLRMIMDIVRPDAGTIELFGQPLCRASLERVSYLPEERGLYRKQSVLDVLVYLGTLKGQSRTQAAKRALHWLERVSLLHTAKLQIERLSKGMSQKVQLVAAFMGEPELYVLDEPFSGLDPLSLREVRALIAEQRALGRGVILSTHQMNEVEDLCDSIALIDRGQLLILDSIKNVLGAHPSNSYRVQSPDDLTRLSQSDRFGPLAVERGAIQSEWVITPSGTALGHEILNFMLASGLRIEAFSPVQATLEQAFLRTLEQRVV